MDGVQDFSDPLYESYDSVVDETDDDSIKDHSSVQSDDEAVSKLSRTKGFLVCI